MKEIDWSKAPEGATHWGPDTDRHCESWYEETDGEIVRYLPADDALQPMLPAVAGSAYYHLVDDLVGRPAPWAGEGLPPVGTVCEASNGGTSVFFKCEVVAVHYATGRPILKTEGFGGPSALTLAPESWKFRPIRTPEQIAAEERDSAINQMIGFVKDHPLGRHGVHHLAQLKIQEEACRDLYDAGYRRQEPSE